MATTAMIPKRKLTYQDYLNMPDDGYYELLNGELVMVPPPIIEHQSAAGELYFRFRLLMETSEIGRVFMAPTSVVLSDTEVVLPDVLFVSNERLRIIGHADIQGAPDLVIEVLSPSTARRDKTVKRRMYARHGVKEYWLVDPVTHTITQLLMRDGPDFDLVGVFGPGETLTSPTLGGFELNPAEVF